MIKAIVTDIEGTTSSIRFVHDVLFPYASKHLPDFIRQYHADTEVKAALEETAKLGHQNPDDIEALINTLLTWIAEDKKIAPLKTLQGQLWKKGYEQGDYQGHVYEDAFICLKQWHEQGIALYVYSSGSVQAQQLLFKYSAYGDMTPLFNGYFDTRTGGKKETESYKKIADAIQKAPGDILFLSDILEELDAAKAAGLQTCQLTRPEDASQTGIHETVKDFRQANTFIL